MQQTAIAILLLYAAAWLGLGVGAVVSARGSRMLKRWAAYNALSLAAAIMIVPFYWMVVTSLKDFSSANKTPPSWLPLGTHYYVANPENPDEQIEVGLVRHADLPWDEIRALEEIEVEPADAIGDRRLRFTVSGPQLRRVRKPEWGNYAEAWNAPSKGTPYNPVTFTRYFYVSTVVALATTLGTLFTSMLAAYAFAKMRFPGRDLFFYIVLATMMVPGQALLIPNFLILAALPDFTFGLQWLDNYPALVVPWLASVFSIFLLRQFFINVPDELWEAAQIDGAGRWRYLWQIMTPLSKPALITAGIFIFLGQWNSLLWPLIVTTSPNMRTLMVGLQTFNEELRGDFHLLMAASTMAILPVVVLFFFLQRFFIQGIARSGIK